MNESNEIMSLRTGGETVLAASFTSPGTWHGHGASQSSTAGWAARHCRQHLLVGWVEGLESSIRRGLELTVGYMDTGTESREQPQRVPIASNHIHLPKESQLFLIVHSLSSLSWRGEIASGNKGISHCKLSGSLGS